MKLNFYIAHCKYLHRCMGTKSHFIYIHIYIYIYTHTHTHIYIASYVHIDVYHIN